MMGLSWGVISSLRLICCVICAVSWDRLLHGQGLSMVGDPTVPGLGPQGGARWNLTRFNLPMAKLIGRF